MRVDEINSHGGSTYYKTDYLEIRLGCRKVYGSMQRDQECEIFKMARFLDENRHIVNLEDNHKAIAGYKRAILKIGSIEYEYLNVAGACKNFWKKLAGMGVQNLVRF